MLRFDDKKILILSLIVSVLCLIGGVSHMLSQWQYYESGQGILLVAYLLACFLLFFAVRFIKPMQILAAFLLLGLIVFYANVKFDWRRTYITNAVKGDYFILEDYIAEYPSLEEYHFGWAWGEPAWVHFAEDCILPNISGQNTLPACRSAGSIQEQYNIDIRAAINEHFRKMQDTAKRIERGQMKSKEQYQDCLMRKQCAFIPLLPANADPERISRDSEDYLLTRRMFWSLINDTEISPEICEYMLLCRVMRDLSVIPIARPGEE